MAKSSFIYQWFTQTQIGLQLYVLNINTHVFNRYIIDDSIGLTIFFSFTKKNSINVFPWLVVNILMSKLCV